MSKDILEAQERPEELRPVVVVDTQPIPDTRTADTPEAQVLPGLFYAEERALTFSGTAINILSQARTKGAINAITRDTLAIGDFIISQSPNIGVGEAKLLRYGASAFTKDNAQHEKKPTLRVIGDTKDFARACIKDPAKGIDPRIMDTPEDQEKENKRAEKALYNFMAKLNKNVLQLMKPLSWKETIKGKIEAFDNIVPLGRGRITKDIISLEFTQTMAEYMVKLPLSDTPRAMYAIDDRKPNAYAIAQELITHYCMENNVIRNTERILKIENLLSRTSFPTQDEIRKNRWSWERLVKDPFEEALDELTQKGLVKDWRYSLSGKRELSEEQAHNILSYEQFASLYIWYELLGFDSHADRLKAIQEKNAESKEKSIEKRRSKSKKTANDEKQK